jgi:hypothetical protein
MQFFLCHSVDISYFKFSGSVMEPLTVVGVWLLSYGGILMGGISGIFSKVSEHKEGKLWKTLPIAGVIFGMFWALGSAYFADGEQRKKTNDEIAQIDAFMKQQADATNSKIDNLSLELFQRGALPSTVHSATPQQQQEYVSSGALADKLAGSIPAERRQLLTIWLFPHIKEDVDFQVVKSHLQQIAGKVEEPPLKQNISPTNSVWFSGGAKFEEAKAAALTVASAGIQIRQICDKSRIQITDLIQVGGSVAAEKMPALSSSQIQSLQAPICSTGTPAS